MKSKVKSLTRKIPLEGSRLAALVVTVILLYLLTRSIPLPSGTYWDLLYARDFDLHLQQALLPETLALLVVQSQASMFGLRVLYHVCLMILCGFLVVWSFKGEELMPGLVTTAIFAFFLGPLFLLRPLMTMLFVAAVLTLFESDHFKGIFGIGMIPVTAAASFLGLNSWLLVAITALYVFFDDEFEPTLILCALVGVLFSPEGAASAVWLQPYSMTYADPAETNLLLLAATIILVPNLFALPSITGEDLPIISFYGLTGIISLLDPGILPVFILVGVMVVLGHLSKLDSFNVEAYLVGVVLLMIVIHAFLFQYPTGFRLNTSVRSELGASLVPLVENPDIAIRVDGRYFGELIWKGLVSVESNRINELSSGRDYVVEKRDGKIATINQFY